MARELTPGKEEKRDGGSLYLQTERLKLRQFTRVSAENLTALDSDPEVLYSLTRDEFEARGCARR